jgi:hypothetical protein
VRSLYDVGPFREHIKRIVDEAAHLDAPSPSRG